jgi:hypothetical protein
MMVGRIPGVSRVMLLVRRSTGGSRRSSFRDAGSTGGGGQCREPIERRTQIGPHGQERWIRSQTRRQPGGDVEADLFGPPVNDERSCDLLLEQPTKGVRQSLRHSGRSDATLDVASPTPESRRDCA